MKYILIAILILCLKCTTSTKRICVEKGTLIIAAVCEDGVIIAADSRSTHVCKDKNGEYIAQGYKDSCQKIFIVKGIPIANTGLNNFDGWTLSTLVEKFNTGQEILDSSIKDIINAFVTILKYNFPAKSYPLLAQNRFYTGGYLDGIPVVISGDYDSIKPIVGGLYYSDKGAGTIVKKYIPNKEKLLPCSLLKDILEKIIIEFGKTNKLVGGPVSIIKVNKDNSYTWIQNDFSKKPSGEDKEQKIPNKETDLWDKAVKESMK